MNLNTIKLYSNMCQITLSGYIFYSKKVIGVLVSR